MCASCLALQAVLDFGAGQADAAALRDVADGHMVFFQREVGNAVNGQEGLYVLHEGFQGSGHAAGNADAQQQDVFVLVDARLVDVSKVSVFECVDMGRGLSR